MKHINRSLAVLVVLAMLLSLAACGKPEDQTPVQGQSPAESDTVPGQESLTQPTEEIAGGEEVADDEDPFGAQPEDNSEQLLDNSDTSSTTSNPETTFPQEQPSGEQTAPQEPGSSGQTDSQEQPGNVSQNTSDNPGTDIQPIVPDDEVEVTIPDDAVELYPPEEIIDPTESTTEIQPTEPEPTEEIRDVSPDAPKKPVDTPLLPTDM